jgi:hypothetical protein
MALRINGLRILRLRSQNPPTFGSWGFDSPSRHQVSTHRRQADCLLTAERALGKGLLRRTLNGSLPRKAARDRAAFLCFPFYYHSNEVGRLAMSWTTDWQVEPEGICPA